MSDLMDRIWNQIGNLSHLNNWIAERQSPYSAPPGRSYEWFPRVETAREAQLVIFLSLHIPRYESDRVIEHIAQLAYRYRYAGEWHRVQGFLESYDTPEVFITEYLSGKSLDDFFGNFLRMCDRYIRYHRRSYRDIQQKGPVRRPNRKRGYSDKGTLRPNHQRGRSLPDPRPLPEDRRSKVNHPLSKFSEVGG